MELDVPFVWQESDYHCGPAVLKMILRFWGKDIPTDEVLMRLARTTPEQGTGRDGMVCALRAFGFCVRAHSPSSIGEVRRSVYARVPVVLNYREPIEDVGHYGIAIGFDNQTIIFHDPWDGPSQRLSVNAFKRRWYGYHRTQHIRWTLIATPNP